MKKSFISSVTKAAAKFRNKGGTDKKKQDEDGSNYYDVVATPDKNTDSTTTKDKSAPVKDSIKEELSTFLMDTSCPALTQIYKADSLWRRLMWSVATCFMFVWMGVQCYWLLEKYYNYPTEVKMDLKVATVLEFPSVTICNLNPILKSKVEEDPFKPLVDYLNPDTNEKAFKEFGYTSKCNGSIYFTCSNENCVPLGYVCDRDNDCGDGSDELNCENHTCHASLFRCSTGWCIPLTWICNGNDNCPNNEDEDNCEAHICEEGRFRCNNHKCIPSHWVCNKYKDCDNDEDESNCTGKVTNTSSTTPPLSTTDSISARRRRDVFDFPRQDDHSSPNVLSSKKVHRLLSHSDIINQEAANSDDTILKNVRGNTEDEGEIRVAEIKESYLQYQSSKFKDIEKNNRTNLQVHADTEARSRVKRAPEPRIVKTGSSSPQAEIEKPNYKKWDSFAGNGSNDNCYAERDPEYYAAMTYAYLTAQLNQSVVEQSGHPKIDMIASCKFAGYECSPRYFTHYHDPNYGNCYTFNSKFGRYHNLTTQFPGQENGLKLELFLDQDNYVANLAPDAGMRILVHKKGSKPFLKDQGISIMPGRSTSIGIKQISYVRLPPPHGSCGYTGTTKDYYSTNLGTDYSKQSCLKSCYQDMTQILWMLVCFLLRSTGYHSLQYDQFNNRETNYEMSISTSMWPSDVYKSFLNKKLSQTNYLYRRVNDTTRVNAGNTNNAMKKLVVECDLEFTKLQIYFRDLSYEQMVQEKSYESMSLVSDFGGQLGLWLGLSVITIGEVCSFLFGVGRSLWFKWRQNKTKHIKNDLTPVVYIKPATLQEMVDEMCPEPAKYSPPEVTVSLPGP